MGARDVLSARAHRGSLLGWVAGSGAPVLLLHGGPGLSYSYLDELGDELAAEFRVTSYQQRGLAPSTLEGPFTMGQALDDVLAVLDGLGWSRALIVGHSWGAHLGLRVAAAHPDRVLAVLAVEPIGVVGDGGMAAFQSELFARVPQEGRRRLRELDERESDEGPTDAGYLEAMEIYWPAYFADPGNVPPMPRMRASARVYEGIVPEMTGGLEQIAAALSVSDVPYTVLAGAGSPIPWGQAARATAELSAHASLTVIGAAGHFPWLESPGCVATALRRLAAEALLADSSEAIATEQEPVPRP